MTVGGLRRTPTQMNPDRPWFCSILDSLVQNSPIGLLALFTLQECSVCSTNWISGGLQTELLYRHQKGNKTFLSKLL